MTVAPDYAEPVLAWRVWLVVRDAGRLALRSVVFPKLWLPAQPAVAQCLRDPSIFQRVRRKARVHAAPAAACACGIYGATRVTAASYLTTPARWGSGVVATVIGLVALWGDVVEADAGWRASRAYPQRLFVPPLRGSREPVVEELAAYGVPVDGVDGWRGADVSAALVRFDPLR